ncbi:MAG: ribosome-associated translation inhibitor RaiA [Candidatus Wolfebacteria bacterium]|nr:ribosome-associated translation inhibitor RaiA [Candidatus Wolfebacteria bacterium]
MNINIKATNIDITPSIREYAETKIGSLSKFIERSEKEGGVKVEIEIGRLTRHHRKGDVFYAEAMVYLPKRILRAENSGPDLRAGIDEVKDKLKIEIEKYKAQY